MVHGNDNLKPVFEENILESSMIDGFLPTTKF